MYVNQSHLITPAGHACMLIFFPIKGISGHLESHLPFGSLFSRFFVIVIQTREYNTHIENSNNRQDDYVLTNSQIILKLVLLVSSILYLLFDPLL